MITPKISQPSAAVALHYNELDPFYREIWGHHVHHGYWRTGKETSAEAAEALSELVAERLDLKPGMSVCDIGCGYGETARLFSSRYGVALEGVTISESQFRVAAARRARRAYRSVFAIGCKTASPIVASIEPTQSKAPNISATNIVSSRKPSACCARAAISLFALGLQKPTLQVLSSVFSWNRSAVTADSPAWERKRIIGR